MPFEYPVALELKGRKCVVIGGGEVAEQKTRSLLDAGADVVVVSESFSLQLQDWGREGRVSLTQRGFTPGDLEGAFLAVAASEDRSQNAEIYKEAERSKVLLNAVDDVKHCHFAAPSIIRRGDFLLTISTGGKAPALAKKLRQELTEQFGPEYGRLVEMLGRVRERMLPKRKVDFDTWAQRWGEAMSEDLIGLVRKGKLDEAEKKVAALIGETTSDDPKTPVGQHGEPAPRSHYLGDTTPAPSQDVRVGKRPEPAHGANRPSSEGYVAIVGAGPGDPDLISVGGQRALKEADVVVADRLVNPELVAGKEVMYVGKEPGDSPKSQDEINMLLIRLAKEGRKVVRLKGGDPFVFGRGGEEAEALSRAGIAFSVLPGATSALAAVAAAGIPVTDRRLASSVAIVTGHNAGSASDYGRPDFRQLAKAVDTIVILMGLENLESIVADLIAGGKDPQCPAAIIENGTLPSERVISDTLEKLPVAAEAANVKSPAIVVVGEVVRLREQITH